MQNQPQAAGIDALYKGTPPPMQGPQGAPVQARHAEQGQGQASGVPPDLLAAIKEAARQKMMAAADAWKSIDAYAGAQGLPTVVQSLQQKAAGPQAAGPQAAGPQAAGPQAAGPQAGLDRLPSGLETIGMAEGGIVGYAEGGKTKLEEMWDEQQAGRDKIPGQIAEWFEKNYSTEAQNKRNAEAQASYDRRAADIEANRWKSGGSQIMDFLTLPSAQYDARFKGTEANPMAGAAPSKAGAGRGFVNPAEVVPMTETAEAPVAAPMQDDTRTAARPGTGLGGGLGSISMGTRTRTSGADQAGAGGAAEAPIGMEGLDTATKAYLQRMLTPGFDAQQGDGVQARRAAQVGTQDRSAETKYIQQLEEDRKKLAPTEKGMPALLQLLQQMATKGAGARSWMGTGTAGVVGQQEQEASKAAAGMAIAKEIAALSQKGADASYAEKVAQFGAGEQGRKDAQGLTKDAASTSAKLVDSAARAAALVKAAEIKARADLNEARMRVAAQANGDKKEYVRTLGLMLNDVKAAEASLVAQQKEALLPKDKTEYAAQIEATRARRAMLQKEMDSSMGFKMPAVDLNKGFVSAPAGGNMPVRAKPQ